MSFDEAYNAATSKGWFSKDEAKAMWEIVFGTLVEVGSYFGRSTMILAHKAEKVISIDPFDGFHDSISGDAIHAEFLQNVQGLPVVNIRKRVEDVDPIDAEVVFLDGDHTYQGTVNQIDFALRCQPKFIAVHDVNDSGDGAEIKRACLEKLGPWKMRVYRLAIWEL